MGKVTKCACLPTEVEILKQFCVLVSISYPHAAVSSELLTVDVVLFYQM